MAEWGFKQEDGEWMAFCSECGNLIKPKAKFCSSCGVTTEVLKDNSDKASTSSNLISVNNSNAVTKRGMIALIQIIILVVAAIYIYTHFIRSSSSAIPESSSQKSSASSKSSRNSVTFRGEGGLEEMTASQQLSGNYQIVWKTFGDCAYFATLGGTDIFSADAATSGTNYISNLRNGSYSVKMTTGPAPSCGWGAVFVPTN